MNINLLFLLHLEVWNKFAQFLFLQNKIVKIEESYNNSFHTKFIKYQYKNGKYSIFLSMPCTWYKTTLVNIRTSVSETISTSLHNFCSSKIKLLISGSGYSSIQNS